MHRALYPLTRAATGRRSGPTLAIIDSQSVKTSEKGACSGFDGHKRVKGRKRCILVDVLGIPIANRIEPASMSDRRAASRLLAGLAPLWPSILIIVADAGHESRALSAEFRREGWDLRIIRRGQRAFKVPD